MSDIQTAERRVHRGEWPALAWSFLFFFCVLSAYYVIRPVRDQLSGAVGSTQLPWFYAATFVATLSLTPVFAWLASRLPRRRLVPAVYLFFIACLLGFMPLFTHEGIVSPRALGIVFFVWISVFNLVVVSVFWTFMADIWNDTQARRLFPLIAVGGSIGSILGPTMALRLVGEIGVAPLLLVASGLLGTAIVCAMALGRWAERYGARRHEPGNAQAVGGGVLDGLKQIFADPTMRTMAILMLLGDCIGTVNYALVVDYSKATFVDAVARTEFAARLDLYTNLFAIGTQVFVTRWLLARHGAAPAVALHAGCTVAVMLMVLVVSDPHGIAALGLPWVAIALLVSRGLAYGALGPARESLFAQVPRSLRYKGKNAVDTAVWRFGDLVVGLSINALRGLGVVTLGFAAINVLPALASGVLGWRLARRIERRETRDAAPVASAG
ncbi:MAG: MFS transporter [Lysobacter sp.]|nr:MAG: MFS transporter [Lysobacter sp.]